MAKRQTNRKRAISPAPSADIYEVLRGDFPIGDAAGERLIHQRTRLAIVSALAVNDSLTFTELKAMLDTTDGNLSVHARKLEDAGYVGCKKSFANRVPRTEYRITALGRRALGRYLDHMESLIRAVRKPAPVANQESSE